MQKQILKYCTPEPKARQQIMWHTGLSIDCAKRLLHKMVADGLLEIKNNYFYQTKR